MNKNTDDSYFPRSHDEELHRQFRLATALSSSVLEESEDLDSEEDNEIQIALARSQAENEEEIARTTSAELQEEELMQIAIFESQASYQKEREIRDLMRVTQQINNNEATRHEMMLQTSIEVQEQLLEWLQDTPDNEEDDDVVLLSFDDYRGEDLPELYKNYRLVPTLFSENNMWPPAAIQQQLTELQVHRGVEDVREWQTNQSEDDRCLVCLTNVATRIAVPCGHRLSCRPCLSSLVCQDNYYSVTTADGQVVPTDRRIPVLCCTCRSIVGQIVTIH